jgi:ketosteroid isomerase-like protein
MSQENVELVRSAFEALNRGDIEGVVAALAPDFEYVASGAIPGVRGVWRGLERYRSFLEAFMDEFEDLHVQIHDVTEAGDQVLVSVTLRVRDKKSEAKVGWNASVLWTVRDRKIVRGQGFTSMEEALEAAGLSE